MHLKKFILVIFFCLIYCDTNAQNNKQSKFNSSIDFVDPFIGTGGHGHTFPGATVPFGMVQLSPDTRLTGWDGCSGYHFTDDVVYGFSHTHLSGTGVSDYGDILLMPYTGKTHFNNGADEMEGYKSSFKKENEFASPAFYKTFLEDDKIGVELTATERTGLHKYTFDKNETKKLIIDLVHRDQVTDSYFKINNKNEIEGYRFSKAWAENQQIFFVIKFNRKIKKTTLEIDGKQNQDLKEANSKSIKAALEFKKSKKDLIVQVGISFVDIEGARKNLEAEFSEWDFDKIKKESQAKWKKELSKIEVESEHKNKKTIFYTALYHTMIAPNLYSDVDGRYRGTDFEIHQTDGHNQYTIFSLWDTYRATHPLYTIIDQERTNDYIKTFLNQYQQGGKLPMWELANNYTGCMIGYHAVPVIADAYIKGIKKYDEKLALKAMLNSASSNDLGIDDYREHGFLPGELEAECVSKTLEYAYDDWCIAQVAYKMGRQDIYEEFYKRGQYYKNIFDPETKFMRARLNNRWFYPFDPSEVNFNYTEANAWQYSYYVPHDIEGWIKLLGGPAELDQKLDDLFTAQSETVGREQVDIPGLIGQYAHGNEPSHHIAYLYNFVGKPYKTQKYVRQIMDKLYSTNPDGLSGNEDCGQMSAWLVLSAMGFYPVTPGSKDYIIGTPWFKSVKLNLENGKTFQINSTNENNPYIQYAKINNTNLKFSFITQDQIMEGGNLNFRMIEKPNENWGKKRTAFPISKIASQDITAVPAVKRGERAFNDTTTIELNCATPNATIFYKINNDTVLEYKKPFLINENTELLVWAKEKNSSESKKAKSSFKKIPKNRSIQLATEYGNHYAAGGDKAMIDFIRGGRDYRTGSWQGYEGVDINAIIDLGSEMDVNKIGIGFLQDENSWIFMPQKVEFFISNDGKNFDSVGVLPNKISYKERGSILKDFEVNLANKNARFIKVVAKNRGVCPEDHKGAGGKCWIFADEIYIE